MRATRRAAASAGVLAACLAVSSTSPASAATVREVASGFAGPLGLAVDASGTLYVAEAFGGQLTTVDRKGRRTVLATGAIGGGVAAVGRGLVLYTDSVAPEAEAPPTDTRLMRVTPGGQPREVASILAYETAVNPDAGNRYGFVSLDADCADQVDEAFGGQFPTKPYGGIVESNPYAVAIDGASFLVADAAGNAVLRVRASGKVSTAAVLPPVETTIPESVVEDFGAPECVVGEEYLAEPVPTDVEVGPDGSYYASSLPGFPEAPGTGSVFRVSPSGAVERVATGFDGAVDLAVARDGTIYVAELFGSEISKVSGGEVSSVVELPSPAAVEVARDGTLYATTDVFGNGTVVTITP